MTKIIYKIKDGEAGKRLDVFLSEKLNETRSSLQKEIKAGLIAVNNAQVLVSHRLKIGDEISRKKETKKAKEKKSFEEKKSALENPIIILDENDDYLIINKPAGLLVHPVEGSLAYTLVDWLLEKYPLIRKVGDDPIRPGIVHRLDKLASGLLVVAKNQNAFEWLKEQFKSRKVFKQYQVLVYGVIKKEEDSIDFPIERGNKGKMAARPTNQTGRSALTEFKVKRHFYNYTLLDVVIKTGRTHQIRAHMSAYNHPVVGDNLYGGKMFREKNEKLGLERLFLTAVKLGFVGPDNKKHSYEIDLPDELKEVLKNVK